MVIKSGVLAVLLVFFIGSAVAERSAELASLQKRDEGWFVAGESEPFSGTAVSRYADGVVKSEIQYRDGLRHGKDTGWYPNGELRYVVRYKKGELQSLGSSWYSKAKSVPAAPDFALCSEHPELGDVCGEAETGEVSHFESCLNKSC